MINLIDGTIRRYLPENVRSHMKSLGMKYNPQNKEWYLDKKLPNYNELVNIINDYLERFNEKESERAQKNWVKACRHFGFERVSKTMDEYPDVKKYYISLMRY